MREFIHFVTYFLLPFVIAAAVMFFVYRRMRANVNGEGQPTYSKFSSNIIAILSFLLTIFIVVTVHYAVIFRHSHYKPWKQTYSITAALMIPLLIAYIPSWFIYNGVRRRPVNLSSATGKSISILTASVSFLAIVIGICMLVLFNIALER